MASTLCPHLFRAYLAKASDIIEIYQPQIVSIVNYESISKGLLHRKVLGKREHKVLLKCQFDPDRVTKLLDILKTRMWGLENLITVLLEENVDNWLADELFQAYVRHLVANMRRIQKEKLCNCVLAGDLTLVKCSWLVVFEKLDAWLVDMGNSLGYLALPLHPVKSLLGFIRERLSLQSRTDAMKSLLNVQYSDSGSDSDNGDEPLIKSRMKQTVGFGTNPLRERSMSTPLLCPRRSLSFRVDSLIPEASFDDDREQHYEEVYKFGRSCPDMQVQELEWDEQADPEFYSALTEDADYILKLIEGNGYTSSFSSSRSSKSSRFGTGEMASQTDISVSKTSISTQTSPPLSPIAERRSNFLPARAKEQQKAPAKPSPKGTLPSNSASIAKVAAVRPAPRRRGLEGLKAKKSNTPSVPSTQVNEDRLGPEDYGKWYNNHLRKSWRSESSHGTNVA